MAPTSMGPFEDRTISAQPSGETRCVVSPASARVDQKHSIESAKAGDGAISRYLIKIMVSKNYGSRIYDVLFEGFAHRIPPVQAADRERDGAAFRGAAKHDAG